MPDATLARGAFGAGDRLAARESVLVAAAAFGLFVVARQDTLHGTDWRWLVLWLQEPGAVHPTHPGYLPLARSWCLLLSPLGLPVHTALAAFSACGAAVGVAGVHRASWWLTGDRAFARAAAALCALVPAWLHFATVVELHAPFAGAMAWAAVVAVRHRCAPRSDGAAWTATGAGVCTGIATGAATLLHATGHLLVAGVVAGWWLAARAERTRLPWSRVVAFALAHAAVWGGGFALVRATGHLPASVVGMRDLVAGAVPDDPARYLLGSLAGTDFVRQCWPTLRSEWLAACAPLSLVVSVGLVWRRLRLATAVLLAWVLLYLLAAVVMVHAATDERGGYLLPLLPPTAWLVLAVVPRRGWPLLLVATAACGFLLRGEPGRAAPDHAFGAAATAMARQQPTVFFVADLPELDGLWLADPHAVPIVARKEYDDLRAAAAGAAFEPDAEQALAWLLLLTAKGREQGARLVVTDAAVAWLQARSPAFAAAWPRFVAAAGARPLPAATGIAGHEVR
jgi:hypothetical protein